MIYYDSHRWLTLLKWKGSIFPRAILYTFPSALFAFLLKYFQLYNGLDLSGFDVLGKGTVFSGFTVVLAFTLVFRTNQAYARYWAATVAAHELSSEWVDACASIISFAQVTRKGAVVLDDFMHTMVRLFSLLHAMALEEVASLEDENFPLIDIQAFRKEDLRVLLRSHSRVQTVLCWIKVYITRSIDDGTLNAPPPMLTRVFQELGSGLVRYHNAQQITQWHFPFPYTQMNLVLIQLYLVLTPIVICTWGGDTPPAVCAALTLISGVCVLGLELIAAELENPFGDDPNDLPVLELQQELNKSLLMLLDNAAWVVPRVAPASERANLTQGMRRALSLSEHCSCLEEVSTPFLLGSSCSKQFESAQCIKPASKWACDTQVPDDLENPCDRLHLPVEQPALASKLTPSGEKSEYDLDGKLQSLSQGSPPVVSTTNFAGPPSGRRSDRQEAGSGQIEAVVLQDMSNAALRVQACSRSDGSQIRPFPYEIGPFILGTNDDIEGRLSPPQAAAKSRRLAMALSSVPTTC